MFILCIALLVQCLIDGTLSFHYHTSYIVRHQPGGLINQNFHNNLKLFSNDEPEITHHQHDDYELEQEMAMEQFNDLKGVENEMLLTKIFMEWDEIQELLNDNDIDIETIEIIMTECGVTSDYISFSQFKEVVDLVNQVVISSFSSVNDDLEEILEDDITLPTIEENEEQVKFLFESIGMKKRQ